MEIVLDKRAVRQIRLSAQDAIEEGDTETLREDILEAFTEEQVEEIERAGLLHLDETPWRESGQLLWLWVFNAVTTVVYFIGARSAEIFVNALQGGFGGCLMSDGYAVYRSYLNQKWEIPRLCRGTGKV
mgnify:CR=1 FL=1